MRIMKRYADAARIVALTGNDFAAGMRQLTIDGQYLRGELLLSQWQHLSRTEGIGQAGQETEIKEDAGT